MTTKTTATLPVLSHPQCDTYEDFELFADDLAMWCSKWVPEIGVPIMRKAEDLYENAAVCILLGKWRDAYKSERRDVRARLRRAAMGDEFDHEAEGGEYEFSKSVFRSDLEHYSQALYALLVC